MKSKISLLSVLLVVSVLASGRIANAALITNGGFEDPVYGSEVVQLQYVSTGWAFYNDVPNGAEAGVMGNACANTWASAGGTAAIVGQCAILTGAGTISQTFTSSADSVVFGFSAQKLISTATPTMMARLDGEALTFGGAGSVLAGGTMASYTSDPVSLSAGSHTLTFQASTWTFLDNVSSSTVPEPSAIVTLLAGLVALLAYAWRKRR